MSSVQKQPNRDPFNHASQYKYFNKGIYPDPVYNMNTTEL